MRKDVLVLEYQEVFGEVVVRIVHQDEEVLKRGEFKDEDIKVSSTSVPDFDDGELFIRGVTRKYDNRVFVVSKEEAEIIKERVKTINEKYGRKERWRAHGGERYYVIEFSKFGNIGICNEKDIDCSFDNNFYELGNYFKTREQAEEACKRVKKVLEQYQQELLKEE